MQRHSAAGKRHSAPEKRQFVFVAFGRGVVLDHEPRWWERVWLRFAMLFRRRAIQPPLDDRIEPSRPPGPDSGGPAGAGDRVPRRPPETPLAGAIALPEPGSADEADRRR